MPGDRPSHRLLASLAAVAAAVVLAAGCGGTPETSATDGATIFSEAGCARCHSLAAADASGRSAPSLDDSTVDVAAATELIGDGRGRMPSFDDSLTSQQIEAVARFVVEQRAR